MFDLKTSLLSDEDTEHAGGHLPGTRSVVPRGRPAAPGKYDDFICYTDSGSEGGWWLSSLRGMSEVGDSNSISPAEGRAGWAGQTRGRRTSVASRLPERWRWCFWRRVPGSGSEAGRSSVQGPRGRSYLTGPAGGGQGCSASSRSSCLKRFFEALLG